MLKTTKNSALWYIGLWLFYRLHGTLYPSGAFYSQLVLLLLVFWSFYHFTIILFQKNKTFFFKSLIVLTCMYIVYGLFLFLTDGMVVHGKSAINPPTYLYIETYLLSLLPIFSFYYFTKSGKIDISIMNVLVPIFILVSITEFYRSQAEMMQLILEKRKVLVDEITNNGGYIVASVLPTLLVYRNKKIIQYSCLVICAIFVLISMKRGAILISMLSILFILNDSLKHSKRVHKILTFSLIAIMAIILICAFNSLLSSSDYFFERLQATKDGDTSSRDELYGEFIYFFINDANIFQQFIGIGANGTLKISFNYAHNDWLETLINQGIIGILIFISFWRNFFRETHASYLSEQSRYVVLTVFFFGITKTFFSMSIGEMTTYTNCVLGFALADGFKNNHI